MNGSDTSDRRTPPANGAVLHVVRLAAPLEPEVLARVAQDAAPALGVSADRLHAFLERKGDAPLTRADDSEVAASFADALRSAGADVRIDVVDAGGDAQGGDPSSGLDADDPADGSSLSVTETWSDVAAETARDARDADTQGANPSDDPNDPDDRGNGRSADAPETAERDPAPTSPSPSSRPRGPRDPAGGAARGRPRRRSVGLDAFLWLAFLAVLAGIAANVLLYLDLV